MRYNTNSIALLLIRDTLVRLPKRFKPTILQPRRPFCSKAPNTNTTTSYNQSGGNAEETSLSRYQDSLKQLDKLDFMKAAKILFTGPPSKRKFGCVSGGSICSLRNQKNGSAYTHTPHTLGFLSFLSSPKSPSQELEQKKKKEEEAKAKEKEIELKAAEEKEASNPELLEVRVRLDKLEETLKEIVVESKKQMNSGQTKEHEGGKEKKDIVTEASSRSSSESSKPVEKDPLSKQDSVEPGPALSKERVVGQHPVPNAHLQDKEGKTPASEDAKR
ncbi:PREDICTED: uncharacterized protein LOC103339340 isoform X1 [Prunus mume]|uniref:Uncharacterized protein LOC103339340 isoform X1 n=1 Tax=Prunus mume TaxID=102107 RepID=A0ABM0PKB0_PRUMU|nr:PREDICTED: uncharacterized protein LOC103339340 isoform X1 [Prunus mume]